jgi:hypothetical protein
VDDNEEVQVAVPYEELRSRQQLEYVDDQPPMLVMLMLGQ